MRISDWSSDVCSSDLGVERLPGLHRLRQKYAVNTACARACNDVGYHPQFQVRLRLYVLQNPSINCLRSPRRRRVIPEIPARPGQSPDFLGDAVHVNCEADSAITHQRKPEFFFPQIERASCRERGCQYVSISVVAVPLKKKKNYNTK